MAGRSYSITTASPLTLIMLYTCPSAKPKIAYIGSRTRRRRQDAHEKQDDARNLLKLDDAGALARIRRRGQLARIELRSRQPGDASEAQYVSAAGYPRSGGQPAMMSERAGYGDPAVAWPVIAHPVPYNGTNTSARSNKRTRVSGAVEEQYSPASMHPGSLYMLLTALGPNSCFGDKCTWN